jgi:hypothetical protein
MGHRPDVSVNRATPLITWLGAAPGRDPTGGWPPAPTSHIADFRCAWSQNACASTQFHHQEHDMTFRTVAFAAAAIGTLGFPAAAVASPVPDPPRTSQTADAVQATVDELASECRSAPVAKKRSIHDEIVLLINVGHAAL